MRIERPQLTERYPLTQIVKLSAYKGEKAEWPDVVYRGWCEDGNEKWEAAYCQWSSTMFRQVFYPHEWNLAQILRWEIRQGRIGGRNDGR